MHALSSLILGWRLYCDKHIQFSSKAMEMPYTQPAICAYVYYFPVITGGDASTAMTASALKPAMLLLKQPKTTVSLLCHLTESYLIFHLYCVPMSFHLLTKDLDSPIEIQFFFFLYGSFNTFFTVTHTFVFFLISY